MKKIVEARPAGGYEIWLRFDDGASGTLDMSMVIEFKGKLSRLRNRAFFKQLTVEHGTITWPGGIDLDPDVLHWELTGRPISGADAPWGAPKIPMAARQSEIKKRA